MPDTTQLMAQSPDMVTFQTIAIVAQAVFSAALVWVSYRLVMVTKLLVNATDLLTQTTKDIEEQRLRYMKQEKRRRELGEVLRLADELLFLAGDNFGNRLKTQPPDIRRERDCVSQLRGFAHYLNEADPDESMRRLTELQSLLDDSSRGIAIAGGPAKIVELLRVLCDRFQGHCLHKWREQRENLSIDANFTGK